jgi:hypothetical protein
MAIYGQYMSSISNIHAIYEIVCGVIYINFFFNLKHENIFSNIKVLHLTNFLLFYKWEDFLLL